MDSRYLVFSYARYIVILMDGVHELKSPTAECVLAQFNLIQPWRNQYGVRLAMAQPWRLRFLEMYNDISQGEKSTVTRMILTRKTCQVIY